MPLPCALVSAGCFSSTRRLLLSSGAEGFEGRQPSNWVFFRQPMLNGTSGFICWSRGFLEVGDGGSRMELLESLKAYSSHGGNPPLLLFPEETTTNGRVGLLRFR